MRARSASQLEASSARKTSRPGTLPARDEATLNVKGRPVPVSNLGKVFYPKTGFTKGQLIDYYIQISPVLLPHLKDRPLTLKRYPNGVEGGFFYEKRCPSFRPAWVRTARVWTESSGMEIQYCMANDLATLVWTANLGDLELHTLLARCKKVDSPTMIAFDLDPGAPADILSCAKVGLWLREKLISMGLESFPKTSGSKGLQVYVPLNSATSYAVTKPLAHQLAQQLEREHPELVVSKMEKRLRTGKVLVDWSQNDRHKTTVCAYSLRAKEQPTVSTPVTWDELEAALKKGKRENLTFLWDAVLKRVRQRGDLFEPVLKLKQKVRRINSN